LEGTPTVIATLRVLVSASKREEVAQALRALRGPTEAYPDCRSCRVYRDVDDENTFALVQEWATQAALDRYIRSELYRTILAVMDMAREQPMIRFDTLASTAGVEVVRAARDPG
jgi:quinol monooxygenase YgiN